MVGLSPTGRLEDHAVIGRDLTARDMPLSCVTLYLTSMLNILNAHPHREAPRFTLLVVAIVPINFGLR